MTVVGFVEPWKSEYVVEVPMVIRDMWRVLCSIPTRSLLEKKTQALFIPLTFERHVMRMTLLIYKYVKC
jgi:hypothetical protein